MRHISSAPGCLGHRRADSRIAGTCIPPATGIVTNTHDMRRQSRTEVETGAKSGGRARRSYLPNTTYSGLVKQPDKQELASFWRETKDPEGVQQDSPGRKPWVQGPNCGKP